MKFDFRRNFLLCIFRLEIQSRRFLRKSNLNQNTIPCVMIYNPHDYLFICVVFFYVLLKSKHNGINESNALVCYQCQICIILCYATDNNRKDRVGVSLRTEKSPVLEVTTCFCFDSRPTQVLWFYVACIRFAK